MGEIPNTSFSAGGEVCLQNNADVSDADAAIQSYLACLRSADMQKSRAKEILSRNMKSAWQRFTKRKGYIKRSIQGICLESNEC